MNESEVEHFLGPSCLSFMRNNLHKPLLLDFLITVGNITFNPTVQFKCGTFRKRLGNSGPQGPLSCKV